MGCAVCVLSSCQMSTRTVVCSEAWYKCNCTVHVLKNVHTATQTVCCNCYCCLLLLTSYNTVHRYFNDLVLGTRHEKRSMEAKRSSEKSVCVCVCECVCRQCHWCFSVRMYVHTSVHLGHVTCKGSDLFAIKFTLQAKAVYSICTNKMTHQCAILECDIMWLQFSSE